MERETSPIFLDFMVLYNHIANKIGAYALELASHILESGNWKDIPLTI